MLALPDIAFRAEVGMPDRLIRQMAEGILDIGVMYTPQLRPGMEVETLLEDELVLVAAGAATAEEAFEDRHLFVDWGPEFQAAHAFRFPDLTNPGTTLALGALGLNYVLENGRAGYFPSRVVKRHIDSGRVRLVPDAPVFPYPAYVVYQASLDPELLGSALSELRRVAKEVELQHQSVVEDLTTFSEAPLIS